MGTWGPGNFDDDTAADHLSGLTGKLISDVQRAMDNPTELEPDEYWGNAVPCNIELLVLIGRQGHVGCLIPDVDTVERWKATYMDVWDRSIDNLQPRPSYKSRRRKILTRTFDELLELARKEQDRSDE